jgi:hypothetical protein
MGRRSTTEVLVDLPGRWALSLCPGPRGCDARTGAIPARAAARPRGAPCCAAHPSALARAQRSAAGWASYAGRLARRWRRVGRARGAAPGLPARLRGPHAAPVYRAAQGPVQGPPTISGVGAWGAQEWQTRQAPPASMGLTVGSQPCPGSGLLLDVGEAGLQCSLQRAQERAGSWRSARLLRWGPHLPWD